MAFTKITAAGIGTTETVTVDGLTVINNGSFGGNLTVAGVLTYEDVTNVDSVGLITARNGIVVGSGITLSKDGDIFATGITTVSGNVKVGTGITLSPDGDIFSTGITTISYTGTAQYGLDVYNPTSGGSGARIRAGDDDSQYALLVENGAGTNLFEVLAGGGGARLRSGDLAILDKIAHYGDGNTFIRFPAADTITAETDGSERARIDSSGRVRIGCTAQPSTTVSGAQFDAGGKALRISEGGGTSSTTGAGVHVIGGGSGTSIGAAAAMGSVLSLLNCNNTDNNQNSIDFMASSALSIAKVIGKNDSHSSRNGSLIFATSSGAAPTEKVRITSAGLVGINETSPDQALHVKSTDGDTVPLRVQSAGNASRIGFEAASSPNSYNVGCGAAASPNAGNEFGIFTNDTERVRVDSSGRLLVNGTSSTSPDGFDSLIQVNASNHEGSITIGRHTANANGPALLFQKSRSGTATPGNGVVSDGDNLGTIRFYASDGTDRNSFAANIGCEVDGTPGGNDMPGALTFSTTADGSSSSTERVRIASDGSVGFGLGSSYAPETPIDVVTNWANTRSDIVTVSSYHRKLPLDERGDITLTARHSATKDGAVGYVGPIIDFRSTNSSNEEWTVAQLVGGTDPLGGNGYQGGLSVFSGNGGNSNPSGRRNQGDAPTLSAVIAPYRITTFCSTGNQGSMAIHVTKNLAANNVQSDMIAFDVGGAGRGKIVSASSGSGNPSFSTYSDRRLKTNFRDYTGGYDRIKAIPVKLYDEVLNDQTKSVFGDNVKTDVIGWIADEVQSVFPEAVRGTKDQVATADDVTAGISTAIGDPVYQSLTEGTFLPDAIQAIQKLIEKVETLEAEVAALKG